MARPLRIEYEGAWYHVMIRGAAGRPIFAIEGDRRAFLEGLAESCETFALEIHAYCLMGNHYHLLARTPRGNLGQAMRHLGSAYTQRYNRAHSIDGPLFRGRYKAILVDADGYLQQLSRYIHRNPVEAGLVERPERYRWSSSPAYIGRAQAPAWRHLDMVLGTFGGGDSARRYQAFDMEGLTPSFASSTGRRGRDRCWAANASAADLRPRPRPRGPIPRCPKPGFWRSNPAYRASPS